MESVTEARGLISDLLLNEETIPKDTQQRLRRVRDILAQRSDKSLNSSKIPFGEWWSIKVMGVVFEDMITASLMYMCIFIIDVYVFVCTVCVCVCACTCACRKFLFPGR